MNQAEADQFATALTELCHQHGVMMWSAVDPIALSPVDPEEPFHYIIKPMEIGRGYLVRRVLGSC